MATDDSDKIKKSTDKHLKWIVFFFLLLTGAYAVNPKLMTNTVWKVCKFVNNNSPDACGVPDPDPKWWTINGRR
jgi:hypothetical protein